MSSSFQPKRSSYTACRMKFAHSSHVICFNTFFVISSWNLKISSQNTSTVYFILRPDLVLTERCMNLNFFFLLSKHIYKITIQYVQCQCFSTLDALYHEIVQNRLKKQQRQDSATNRIQAHHTKYFSHRKGESLWSREKILKCLACLYISYIYLGDGLILIGSQAST